METDTTKPATNAERQARHRQRVKDRLAGLPPAPPPPAPKKPTRPKQLVQAISILEALKDGYESWLEGLPPNLTASEKAGQLQETIDHLAAALDSLEAIDPPRVGR